VFSRNLLLIHKKICTSGSLGPGASPCHLLHLFFSASPRAVQQSHGLSVCEWPVWLYLLLSPRSTLRAVRTEGFRVCSSQPHLVVSEDFHGEQGVRSQHLFAVDSGEGLRPELCAMEVGIRDAFVITQCCTLFLKLLNTQTPIMLPSLEYVRQTLVTSVAFDMTVMHHFMTKYLAGMIGIMNS